MLPIVIRETAANVVAMTGWWLKLVTLRKLGAMIKPPPTPNRPDRKPVNAPVLIRRFMQEAVQESLEVAGLSMQAGVGACELSALLRFVCQERMPIKSRMPISVMPNIWLELFCANLTPNGANTIPVKAIKSAVL